jgi:hypothetical protein
MQTSFPPCVNPASPLSQPPTVNYAGNLETPLYKGPGNNSWPIPFITFLALSQHVSTLDCTSIKELLNFIAWTQINDQAIAAVSDMGYMPLAFAYRSKLIDLLSKVTCNGEQALPTAYLLGVGWGLPVYTDWSLSYSNTDTNLKIYADYDKSPLEQITSGTVRWLSRASGLRVPLGVHSPPPSFARRCGRL